MHRRLTIVILLALLLSGCSNLLAQPTSPSRAGPTNPPAATLLIVTRAPRTLEAAPSATLRGLVAPTVTARSTLPAIAANLPTATKRPTKKPPTKKPPTATQRPSNPNRYPAMPKGLTKAQVTKVVDGDTFDVALGGDTVRVRLIGMNTPESVDPRRVVECFGKEASARAKKLLAGQTVYLEEDPSQDSIDQYGRILRFAWFSDGRMFNLQMIAEGYAFEYTYNMPYKYQREFMAAEQEADRASRGLWSPQTCNGERKPAQ